MSRKSLTFKTPDRMKVLALIFIFGMVFSPSVHNFTAQVLYTTADIISTHD